MYFRKGIREVRKWFVDVDVVGIGFLGIDVFNAMLIGEEGRDGVFKLLVFIVF